MYIIVIGRTSSILGAIGSRSRSREVERSREVKNLFRGICALSERLFLVYVVINPLKTSRFPYNTQFRWTSAREFSGLVFNGLMVFF